jgi:hypothetical protein
MKLLQKAVVTTTIATTVTLIGWSSNALAASFSIVQNFQGSTINQSGFIPPDTTGAIGNNHFVELLNGRYAVYNKTGNGNSNAAIGSPLFSSTLDQFWTAAGVADYTASTFDPRLVFDPSSQRWFAAAVDSPTDLNAQTGDIKNNFLLAVSKTDNPLGGWTGFKIPGDPTRFTDFPTLGLNKDGVFLGSNNFGRADAFGNFDFDVSLVSIRKAALLSGTLTSADFKQFNGLDFGIRGGTLHPVTDFNSGGNGIVIGNFNGGLANPLPDAPVSPGSNAPDPNLAVSSIKRTNIINPASGTGATLSSTTNISVTPSYIVPPGATQRDGTTDLDAGDNRFGSTTYKVGNSIWLVHTVADPVSASGRAALRWYELDATTNAIKQSGTIGDAAHDYFYPSIAANEFGNVVIGFSRSGLSEFASSYAIAGSTNVMGKTTFDATPTLLKAGQDNYFRDFDSGRNRWGDYSATMVDPNDPLSFWTIQEFALTSGNPGGGTGRWATQITQLKFDPIPTPAMLPGLLGVGVSFWRKRRQSAQAKSRSLN